MSQKLRNFWPQLALCVQHMLQHLEYCSSLFYSFYQQLRSYSNAIISDVMDSDFYSVTERVATFSQCVTYHTSKGKDIKR